MTNLDCGHELVDELIVFLAVQARLLQAEVAGVVEEFLVVGTHVYWYQLSLMHATLVIVIHRPFGLTNNYWEDAARVEASGGDVEVKFAYGDSQAPDPEVAEAENPPPVGHCQCEMV